MSSQTLAVVNPKALAESAFIFDPSSLFPLKTYFQSDNADVDDQYNFCTVHVLAL
ncbi:hypothetical protein [Thiomicrorhabdus arctica]|uniref:hypothetical protein n=1 Tax=Thiomicrorhabdus arctica TaxID=131540 RepID=UPI00036E7B4D|nr:hypothetical protein [Thiomicrorhabdus arctica]